MLFHFLFISWTSWFFFLVQYSSLVHVWNVFWIIFHIFLSVLYFWHITIILNFRFSCSLISTLLLCIKIYIGGMLVSLCIVIRVSDIKSPLVPSFLFIDGDIYPLIWSELYAHRQTNQFVFGPNHVWLHVKIIINTINTTILIQPPTPTVKYGRRQLWRQLSMQ